MLGDHCFELRCIQIVRYDAKGAVVVQDLPQPVGDDRRKASNYYGYRSIHAWVMGLRGAAPDAITFGE